MGRERANVALVVFLVTATITFAALFGWQYAKNERSHQKSSTPSITSPISPTQPVPNGCPFYPQPQKIDIEGNAAFSELFKWMDEYLKSTLDSITRPSLSANLVYLDEVIWKGNFGNISKTKHRPPTEDTIYRIASISKLFPTLLLYKLWEDGKVNLYDPITKYAPDFSLRLQMGAASDINLIDMASQISGLPLALPFNPISGSELYYAGNLEDALLLLEDQILAAEPRTTCIYSNLAYALLGDILARNFSEGNFTRWAQADVIEKLELDNTGFTYDADVISNMATGYLDTGAAASVFDLGWYGPAGNYYSTAGDLAKFSMSFLETSKTILKHSTLTEMMRPRKDCQHDYLLGLAQLTGSPWEMQTIDENLIVRKEGGLPGYSSSMALVPSLKIAFNVLMSGTNNGENVAGKILQEVIPVFREALRSLEQKITPTPDRAKYTGTYSYYNLQTRVIKEGPGGVILMEDLQVTGRYNTSGLSFIEDGVFRLVIRGGEYPCSNLDAQNQAIVHFRDYTNGSYNTFDVPATLVYGFKRV